MVWNPGDRLFGGRYIVQKKLRPGGCGITYLVKDQIGQLFVVKTLKDEVMTEPEFEEYRDKYLRNFKIEAQNLAACRHEHIVRVKDYFNEGSLPCLVMEYIEGQDLSQRLIRNGPLPEAEATRYICQIGEALTLVHENGLLHRDLKPHNIMVRTGANQQGNDEAVLIDFGIAREFIPNLTKTHTTYYTPGFAPPEQYDEQARRGEFTDVYALAATYYCLVTGKKPLAAPVRAVRDALIPPQEVNPQIAVSDTASRAMLAGLQLQAGDRPQSVLKWLEQLPKTEYRSHGEHSHNASQAKNSNTNQMPIWSALVGTIGVACLAVFAVQKLANHSNSVGQPPVPTPTVASVRVPPPKVSWEKTVLVHTFEGHQRPVMSVAISRDGKTVASSGEDLSIKLWDLDKKNLIDTLRGHSVTIFSLAISRDGKTVASGDNNGTIKLWNIDTEKQETWESNSGYISFIGFEADGESLAIVGHKGTMKLWNYEEKELIQEQQCSEIEPDLYSAALSYGGKQVACGYLNGKIALLNLDTKEKTILEQKVGRIVASVAFTPDDKTLVSGSYDGTVKLWDLEEKTAASLKQYPNQIESVAISPDGGTLAVGSSDGTMSLWSMETREEIHSITTGTRVNAVAFSQDSTLLVSGHDDNTIKVWKAQRKE